jgi:lipoyl(octanoyl) transferase
MKNEVIFRDLGLIEFGEAWNIQKKLISEVQQSRINKQEDQTRPLNYLLFCEHPHVFTLGKSGSEKNLLVNEQFLKQKGASFYHIDRGGDITYHGPGQIVGYPIFDLENFGMGVKNYVQRIEEVVIQMLDRFGIRSARMEGATGVWLDLDKPGKTRKICAIGVKVSRSVTMHGFALNVNTDLTYFNLINPCGFTDRGVTSMGKELGMKTDMNQVKEMLKNDFSRIFDFRYRIN